MNSRSKMWLTQLLMILIAIGVFAGTSYAQFTVTVTGETPGGFPIDDGSNIEAPGNPLKVKATVSPLSGITKVVFYRNDVPYMTDTSWPFEIEQGQLGQENYTYHARAYHSSGVTQDSNDYRLSYYTPRIIRMGDPDSPVKTSLPGRFVNHTEEIREAVNYLGEKGGGTLFFPCTIPPDSPAIYNIKSTIYIPPNVTLQGESAEEGGPCRIYWNDVSYQAPWGCATKSPAYLHNAAMFKIAGGTSRVRFRDLVLMSRTTGPGCDNRADFDVIADENTAAVEMNTDDGEGVGDITNVIFENVTITHFTKGVKAVSNNASEQENEISGVKIRAFHPYGNTVALFIDAKYAYNWDIQNFNPSSIVVGQGAVEIRNAGKPSVTDGEDTKIKFLQLNCNGQRAEPRPFCVKVQKHGGLYFRQLHHEGVDKAIIVEDISENRSPFNTNPDPIVFESSVASGEFNDPSMKLYLIGNGFAAAPEIYQEQLDDARMKFKGRGRDSTVVDCGDVHWDWTDVVDDGEANWPDYQMLFTHSERYRGSFFAETVNGSYIKPHRYCPSGVPGYPNIEEIGGEFFDSGILPNEPGLYSKILDDFTCPQPWCDADEELQDLLDNGGGSVYINGVFHLDETVNVPRGSQIIGASPDAELILDAQDKALFRMDVKILTLSNQTRLWGVVIRNLKLTATQSGATGIALLGETDPNPPPPPNGPRPGASSDLHFSGLTFTGFTKGIYAAAEVPGQGHPMIDGVSMKNMTFVNNETAVLNLSSNSSNWNVMNLNIQSFSGAVGWSQITGGHQGLQDVRCTGPAAPFEKMTDCLRIRMAGGFFLNGLRRTTEVANSLTVGESGVVNYNTIYQAPHPTSMVLRNSDFTGSHGLGRVTVLGKAHITSMNNKYHYFNVESQSYGNQSRLTYCGDTYNGAGGAAYPGLADFDTNLWVGMPTATRVQCGDRPIPWDEAVRWTNKYDEDSVGEPMVGNFFHDTQEDFVVFRRGSSPTKFLIQQSGGPGRLEIDWGLPTDTPLIGNFFPNTWAQIVVFRDGAWWVNDPKTPSNNTVWSWGLAGDRPFVGNFIKESSSPDPEQNKDEIAVYRPSTGSGTFWITNPRLGGGTAFTTSADPTSEIQVADFLGEGYDQIAQYKDGVWRIVDPRTGFSYTVNFGQACDPGQPCDIPVAGMYLEQLSGKNPCAQVAVWRPSTQQFLVADPVFVATNPPNLPTNCGARTESMVWGLNNGSYLDDIPLTINDAVFPLLSRPTAYRRTKGAYDHSLGNGQWWVHDRF